MIKKIFNLFSASDLILAVVFMLIICIMILPVESGHAGSTNGY